MDKKRCLPIIGTIVLLLGCTPTVQVPTATDTSVPESPTTEPSEPLPEVVFDLNTPQNGLLLDSGGDVDTEIVIAGSPEEQALRTGNGKVVDAPDGNTVEDYYMQFRIDDTFIYQGKPTTRVKIEVEYLDVGTDTFSIQYDALAGKFSGTGVVAKPIPENSRRRPSPCAMPILPTATTGRIFASLTIMMGPRPSAGCG